VATDIVQKVREAIVTILDTHASIVAITGRANGNIVSWDTLADQSPTEVPILAYLFVVARKLPADGDTREALFQLTADGPKESQRHELLGVVEQLLDQPAFLALATPLDAFEVNSIRRDFNLDVTLRVAA
jgi:hypothetical protein